MRRILTLLFLLVLPVALVAQKPKGLRASIARADAAVDSSAFRFELGADSRIVKTGDSLPADVRIGVVISPAFTLEGSVAAKQDSAYLEADVAVGLTGSVFPGSSNYHGQFLFAAPLLHYEGGAFQYGLKFGTGMRAVAAPSAGMIARVSAGVEHRFQRGGLAASNQAYVELGLSFFR